MSSRPTSSDFFTIEQHGEITLLVASSQLELLDQTLAEEVAAILVEPIAKRKVPLVVVDLADVTYFGSIFLTVLLRCWRLVQSRDGQMALSGVTPRTRELLHVTSLDMIWPMYDTRREAFEALLSD